MIEQAVSIIRNKLKNDYKEAFGKVMKKKRTKAGLSQQELGTYIGVDKSTVSRYEKGVMEIPASTLPLTCEACNFKMKDYVASVDDIITEKRLLEIYTIKENVENLKKAPTSEDDHYTEDEKHLVEMSYNYLIHVEQIDSSKDSLDFSVDLVLETMHQKAARDRTYARLQKYMDAIDNLKKPVVKEQNENL